MTGRDQTDDQMAADARRLLGELEGLMADQPDSPLAAVAAFQSAQLRRSLAQHDQLSELERRADI